MTINSSSNTCDKGATGGHCVTTPERVGFVTPWNQVCGLATYAKFLVPHLQKNVVAIFAESHASIVGKDEPFVTRCWQRQGSGPAADDYTRLESAIAEARLDILHVNCQAAFFVQPLFSEMLKRAQARGVKVVIHIHQIFSVLPENRALLEIADKVIVHCPENKLEAIANGANPEHVIVIPHGVDLRLELADQPRENLRRKLGLAVQGSLITSFGFIQPHKGMEAVIEAVAHLRVRGVDARGLIIGESRSDQPNSADYLRALQEYARSNSLGEYVTFISTYIPDERVGEYLAASDLVVMNYRSNYFESSGACSLAVGAGAVVMSSLAPAQMHFGDAVWHMTAGYPAGISAELLLTNPTLYDQVRSNARQYAQAHAWHLVAKSVERMYSGLFVSEDARPSRSSVKTSPAKDGSLRILMQNRGGTFTQRGGDTVVLERLSEGLKRRGCDVTIDVTGSQDPSGFDLVHLFNFATPELTQHLGSKAKAAGVPFVVTTLYEDLPHFHHQSHAIALHVVEYVMRGQDKAWWASHALDLASVPPATRFKADWIAENASALFTNGGGESAAIERDFPRVKQIVEVPLGHEVGCKVGPELFEREYGVRDFVLCVGRLETRKNQLMLLKALEDSDLTVVLAGGGFSYQPEYENAVKAFKRKGRTIILGRLSPEMLSSAYAACRIHVLPSWYELPGLVSLEAAAHGKNIVVTRTGTSADYVGEKAFYCQPWDSDSINAAIMAAFYAPVKEGLVEMTKSYTWENAVDKTILAYEGIAGGSSVGTTEAPQATPVGGCYDMSVDAKEIDNLVEQGEIAAREGDYSRADALLQQAEAGDPTSPRVLKARGAVSLAQGRIEEARAYFGKALTITPHDPSLLTGMGMCISLSGQAAGAMPMFEQALAQAPDHLVALHQLLECAYQLNAYNRAESALRRYLSMKPHETEIRFCLAGVLYKQGLMEASTAELVRVVTERPDHESARQLQELIANQVAKPVTGSVASVVVEQSMKEAASNQTEATTGAAAEYFQSRDERNSQMVSFVDGKMDEVESLKRDGRHDEARHNLEKIRRSPGITVGQRERFTCIEAEFLVMDGDLSGAGEMYERVLGSNPTCVRALCGKGALAAERQEWSVAQDYFERALAVEPSHDVGLAGLGLCAMVGQKEDKAFELFTQAVASNPENRRALLGVLQLGYPMKKYTEIEKALNSYLAIHPANIEMMYSFAGILFTQGKVEQAKSEVEKILIFEPQHSRALELRDIIRGEKSIESIVV